MRKRFSKPRSGNQSSVNCNRTTSLVQFCRVNVHVARSVGQSISQSDAPKTCQFCVRKNSEGWYVQGGRYPRAPAGSKSCASSVSRMFLPPWKMNPRRCEFASPARGLDWMHFRHSPAGPSVGAGVGFSFSQGAKMAARGAGAGSVAPTSNGGGHRVTFFRQK